MLVLFPEELRQRREDTVHQAPLNLSTKDISPTSPESPSSSSPIFDFKTETILKHESNQSPSPRHWTKEEEKKRWVPSHQICFVFGNILFTCQKCKNLSCPQNFEASKNLSTPKIIQTKVSLEASIIFQNQKSFKACKNISMSVSPSPGPVSPPVVWRSSPPRHHRLWSPLVNTEETQRRIWSPAVTCEEENKINKNNNNTSGLLVEVK